MSALYTLSLHDALPILAGLDTQHPLRSGAAVFLADGLGLMVNEEDHLRLQALRSGFALQEAFAAIDKLDRRSEEHTSELQSLRHLVCRLLLEKKKHIAQ